MRKILLPLILFVGLIGGVAFITQNLSNWRAPVNKRPETKPDASETVTPFVRLDPAKIWYDPQYGHFKSWWDPADRSYFQEVERDLPGHFDFHIDGNVDHPIEVGLQGTSCDCAHVESVAFTPEAWESAKTSGADAWAWKKMQKSEDHGLKVPTKGHAVLRINWSGRKEPGQKLNLVITFWVTSKESNKPKQGFIVAVPTTIVTPVMFVPERINVGGLIEKAQGQFYIYSATRPNLEVALKNVENDPLVSAQLVPLSDEECKELQDRLNDPAEKSNARNTRVKKGYKLDVTLFEQKGGMLLDQGHFQKRIPLLVDGEDNDGPTLQGYLRGDLDVGSVEDQGKVQLKTFAASEGIDRVIAIRGEPKLTLEIESIDPAFLEAKLTPNVKESTAGRGRWDLRVIIPPNSVYGELTGSIVVKSQSPQNSQIRRLRIPVFGTAGQR